MGNTLQCNFSKMGQNVPALYEDDKNRDVAHYVSIKRLCIVLVISWKPSCLSFCLPCLWQALPS